MTLVYRSTKTYGHEQGFSTAFRQWRADSHCRFLHGYALSFKFTFESQELDVRNWVVDFGGLKSLKQVLSDNFDHKTLVAEDDPNIDWFVEAHRRGIIDMVKVPSTGCEMTAKMVFEVTDQWLKDAGFAPRCRLIEVEVMEHPGNSAIYRDCKDPIKIDPIEHKIATMLAADPVANTSPPVSTGQQVALQQPSLNWAKQIGPDGHL